MPDPAPDATPLSTLRLAARGSLLSRAQSLAVARQLQAAHPGLRVELVVISTSGDRITDHPLHSYGGKGLFTQELELALLRGEVDFAVHSYKDVPVTMPLVDGAELLVAAIPPRENPADALVSLTAGTLDSLPPHARLGTSSLRRRAQVLAARPDLDVQPLRGNVDTRIGKLRKGHFDAVIIAVAGVKRAGLWDNALMHPIPMDVMLPAAGQGALALQCRRDATRTRALLQVLHDPATSLAVGVERQVVRLLNGDCHSPIAALVAPSPEGLILHAAVGGKDGRPPVLHAQAPVDPDDPDQAAHQVVERLLVDGARELLAASSVDFHDEHTP